MPNVEESYSNDQSHILGIYCGLVVDLLSPLCYSCNSTLVLGFLPFHMLRYWTLALFVMLLGLFCGQKGTSGHSLVLNIVVSLFKLLLSFLFYLSLIRSFFFPIFIYILILLIIFFFYLFFYFIYLICFFVSWISIVYFLSFYEIF